MRHPDTWLLLTHLFLHILHHYFFIIPKRLFPGGVLPSWRHWRHFQRIDSFSLMGFSGPNKPAGSIFKGICGQMDHLGDTSYWSELFDITNIKCSLYLIQILPLFLHRLRNCSCVKPPPGLPSLWPGQIASPDSCVGRFQTAGRCRGWSSASLACWIFVGTSGFKSRWRHREMVCAALLAGRLGQWSPFAPYLSGLNSSGSGQNSGSRCRA